MNDRLEYKVFDKRNNKLKEIKGYTFSLMGFEDLVTIQWADGFHEGNIPLKDLIFCQCTGLKDRNGKLIYEGDIVKDTGYYFNMFCKVGFKKCAFFLENNDVIAYFHELRACFSENRLEIIGNIYTTPELLEEQ